MGRPKLYVPIPAALLEGDADSYAIAVYAALKRHTDYGEETGARPADATLAAMAGCSERSVRNAREYLQKHGWIDWTARKGTTNAYIVRNEPLNPPPRSDPGPRHDVPTPADSEQLTIEGDTPAPHADVRQSEDTPAPHAEVVTYSEDTPAPGAEGGRHQVPTTEYPMTDKRDTSLVEASSLKLADAGTEPPPPQPKGELTMEPDRSQAEADAIDEMREIRDQLANEYLDSDRERRRLKAATEMIIGEPLGHWRNPHTMDVIPPADRPALLRTAILHHIAEPAHNMRSSLRYTLKAELDPYNVPEGSEAASAREREARANGTPRSDDPVNGEALARAGADPKTIPAPKSAVEQRIERARRFREQHPDRYDEIRDQAEAQIRNRINDLQSMPDKILEGMVLNEIDSLIAMEGG